MDIKKFAADDQAVSPVIGVILMVAITVILAAVIATFVLGLGDSVNQSANAGVAIDQSSNANGEQVDITVTSLGSNADTVQYQTNDNAGDTDEGTGSGWNDIGTSAGDSVVVGDGGGSTSALEAGDTIVVRVTGTGDTKTAVIQTYEVT